MKKVCVMIRDKAMQYEGLRTSLGLLLEDHGVRMFVIDHEIVDYSEAYSDNLGFLFEMGGTPYSNNRENVDKYKFQYAGVDCIGNMLGDADIIIPF